MTKKFVLSLDTVSIQPFSEVHRLGFPNHRTLTVEPNLGVGPAQFNQSFVYYSMNSPTSKLAAHVCRRYLNYICRCDWRKDNSLLQDHGTESCTFIHVHWKVECVGLPILFTCRIKLIYGWPNSSVIVSLIKYLECIWGQQRRLAVQ